MESLKTICIKYSLRTLETSEINEIRDEIHDLLSYRGVRDELIDFKCTAKGCKNLCKRVGNNGCEICENDFDEYRCSICRGECCDEHSGIVEQCCDCCENICSNCYVKCSECGNIVCDDCRNSDYCDNCIDKVYCNFKRCSVVSKMNEVCCLCASKYCVNHAKKCKECEDIFCDDCICKKDKEYCDICYEENKCVFNNCPVMSNDVILCCECDERFCEKHIIVCMKCDERFCEKHIIVCMKCDERFCYECLNGKYCINCTT